MRGVAELIIQLFWKFLSGRSRETLARRIMALRARGQIEIPRSDCPVYAFSKSSASLFGVQRFSFPSDSPCYPSYSLVLTCRNEAASIVSLLDSVASQNVPPAEVIICDGGSTDGTPELIAQWAKENARDLRAEPCHVMGGLEKDGVDSSFSIILLREGRMSISAGRNRAVSQTSHALLLFTDAGNTLDRFWAERLLSPFVHDEETEMSMGWYRPLAETAFQRAAARFLIPQLESLDPGTFLPSGRSLALKKSLFDSVGGYPEHLSHAGEDSLFDFYVKTAAKRTAFVPDALVYWKFPHGVQRMAKTVYGYARGDAEGGILFWDYYLKLVDAAGRICIELVVLGVLVVLSLAFGSSLLCLLCGLMVLCILYRALRLIASYQPFAEKDLRSLDKLCRVFALTVMIVAQFSGFLRGFASRRSAEARRIAKASEGHLVLLLPGYHRFDSESETTRLILEYLSASWYITIVYARSARMPDQEHYPFEHPQLENHLRSAFDLETWDKKYGGFFRHAGRKFCFLDLCDDALSRDLVKKLSQLGAGQLARTEF